MSMISRIAVSASLPLIIAATAASAGNARLEALFNRQPTGPVSNLCFVRHYDKAHLASHPHQNVTDMFVYFARKKGDEPASFYYTFDAAAKFRDSNKSFSFDGDCNRDASKPGLSVRCRIDCDGGGFNVDARDEKSAELQITAGLRLGEPDDGDDEKPLGTNGFDTDDTTFLLHQTALKDCLPVVYDDDMKADIANGSVTQ
jgi:hypothetical protein